MQAEIIYRYPEGREQNHTTIKEINNETITTIIEKRKVKLTLLYYHACTNISRQWRSWEKGQEIIYQSSAESLSFPHRIIFFSFLTSCFFSKVITPDLASLVSKTSVLNSSWPPYNNLRHSFMIRPTHSPNHQILECNRLCFGWQ